MLATLDDINTHLPDDRLKATEGNEEVNRFQIDVDRTIKGYLSTVYSTTIIAVWDEPVNTPEFIRGIAGRLIAAYWYAAKVSESLPDWDGTYPKRLYDEAMKMLTDLRLGNVDLGLEEEAGTQFSNAWFSPNSDSREPSFRMSMNL